MVPELSERESPSNLKVFDAHVLWYRTSWNQMKAKLKIKLLLPLLSLGE